MIDRNHPAVEAANRAVKRAYGSRGGEALAYHATALRAALPHLTADDLRDTPTGRALRAVLNLHFRPQPIPAAYGAQTGLDYCRTCAEDWPCPTVAAITRALEGENHD